MLNQLETQVGEQLIVNLAASRGGFVRVQQGINGLLPEEGNGKECSNFLTFANGLEPRPAS